MAKDKNAKSKAKILGPVALEQRKKALDDALSNIEKQFGKGSLMKLGDKPKIACEVIPTGIMAVDLALGIGGLPKGRIIEIYGAESSGKTTVALHTIAQAQKEGGVAAFVDAEHALDPRYAAKLGVDINELLISQPDNGEEALEITEALVRSAAVDIIVVDSVAALVPRAEINGDMGDSQVGVQARLMSQALRKLAGIIAKSQTVVVFINQLRDKVGLYGPSETTSGGRALKFYASVRIEIKRGEAIKEGDQLNGVTTKVKVVKNKMAPPFRTCEFDMIFGEGASKESSLLDSACELEIIKKSGSWFSYKDSKIAQGREKARLYLKENPEVYEEIAAKVFELIQDKGAASSNSEENSTEQNESDDDDILAGKTVNLDDKSLDDILNLDEIY